MVFDGADTIVMFEKLAYEDLLPVRWQPLSQPIDDLTAQAHAARNMNVLRACDALEEHGHVEKSDEDSPHSADLMRLDFKLNLLLEVMGQLLTQSQPRVAPRRIRFNAMGASWITETPPAVDSHGVLEITLRDIIVQPLALPAQIVSGATPGTVRARFLSLGEAVADHIEKLVFRRHRRKIAVARGVRS